MADTPGEHANVDAGTPPRDGWAPLPMHHHEEHQVALHGMAPPLRDALHDITMTRARLSPKRVSIGLTAYKLGDI
jgi:hypothetical protein